MQTTLPTTKHRILQEYAKVFALCAVFCCIALLPLMLADLQQGRFMHYVMDYMNQQIPFISDGIESVRQGISYSWSADLGSGFLDANSFGMLGNPHFWLLCLFPTRWVPYLMPVMVCLYYGMAGGGAYLWARRWCKNSAWAMVAGCLYAFCGFNAYGLLYFSFFAATAFFPYLLAALDAAALEGKHGHFLFWVALNMLNSYFFFIEEVVFLVLYFACMVWGKKYRLTKSLFARLAFESVCGCGFGCLLFLPAILYTLQSTRATSVLNGIQILLYATTTHYLQIILSVFLVPDEPGSSNLFGTFSLTWISLTAYLPLVGISGGWALCKKEKTHPLARLLLVCLLFAFVPILNSVFCAFNAGYYARWFFMPVLILAGAAAVALDDANLRAAVLPKTAKWVFLCTAAVAVLGLLPTKNIEEVWQLGVAERPLQFWALFLISLACSAAFCYLLRKEGSAPQFSATMLLAVLAAGMVTTSAHWIVTKSSYTGYEDFQALTYDSVAELNEAMPDAQNSRIDAFESMRNLGFWLNRSCIQAYSSTVSQSIAPFYEQFGLVRAVSSDPEPLYYALRGLLGVKYTVVPLEKEDEWQKLCTEGKTGSLLTDGDKGLSVNIDPLSGWKRTGETTYYAIYENENYVPLGVCYDYYTTEEDLEGYLLYLRGNYLMKAIYLTDAQVEKYGDLLAPLPESEYDKNTYADYEADCATNRANALTDFTMTKSGFTATADLDKTRFVLFAVPYDDGFTATANGEPLEIEKVDNGLMAVVLPAGHTEVEFTYHTPGLKVSMAITAVSALLAAAYLLLSRRRPLKAPLDEGAVRATD